MPSIIYPITASYRAQWQLWDAFRECIWQEFLDLFATWTVEQSDGKTVIEGCGAHMALRHLLLGGSDKTETQRGQFGEGTKLGWLVLLREGVPFSLTSGEFHGLHACWADLYGQQVMEVCWDEGAFFDGSRYELAYAGELWQERVIRPGDARILFTDEAGRMILEEAEPQFYVKGLWIGPARPYGTSCAFGYNLNLKLAEDRQLADAWQASREIGRLWANVANQELLARFWQAVADRQAEADTHMAFRDVQAPKAQAAALRQAFGSRAVVATDAVTQREAEYRGLKPVHLQWGLEETAKEIIGTDREELAALSGRASTLYPKSRLSAAQRRVLDLVRRLSQRAGIQHEVQPYMLPPSILGQALEGRIALDISVLDDLKDAVATWLHEAAHVEYGTDDATAAHVDAVAQVAARVIVSYAAR